MPARLALTRAQILAFRRAVQSLDTRLPPGPRALRRAAWAGLQDSMPRAALLSMHARVRGITPASWEAPSLVQLWGPRYSAYLVDARDRAVFTLGRLPEAGATRRVADELAVRLERVLAGSAMSYEQAGRTLGEPPNRLRYAALTGTVLMRWDGAKAPTVWTVPPPDVPAREARVELVRRYLHVFGPATADGCAAWAGISPRAAAAAFEDLRRSLVAVRTPIGDAWLLARDEPAIRRAPVGEAPARLLPSGDVYFLLQGADRALLVEDAARRDALWTSRVWPGALLVAGDIVGTWRRAQGLVSIDTWRPLSRRERRDVDEEAATLPLPGIKGAIVTRWNE